MTGQARNAQGQRTSDVRSIPQVAGAVLVAMRRADEQNFVAFALRRRGHRVHCASAVDEARQALAVSQFDALVADDALADADGRLLLRAARAHGVTGALLLSDNDIDEAPTSRTELRFKRPLPIL